MEAHKRSCASILTCSCLSLYLHFSSNLGTELSFTSVGVRFKSEAVRYKIYGWRALTQCRLGSAGFAGCFGTWGLGMSVGLVTRSAAIVNVAISCVTHSRCRCTGILVGGRCTT